MFDIAIAVAGEHGDPLTGGNTQRPKTGRQARDPVFEFGPADGPLEADQRGPVRRYVRRAMNASRQLRGAVQRVLQRALQRESAALASAE